MLWHGFPVVRYLAGWLLLSVLLFTYSGVLIDGPARNSRPYGHPVVAAAPWYDPGAGLLVCLLAAVALAGAPLQQGPPCAGGAACTTDSLFANQLGLNATLSLADAAKEYFSSRRPMSGAQP